MFRKILIASALALAGVFGVLVLFAAVLWISPRARYRAAYLLVEHTDVNGEISAAQLARHARALRHATLVDAAGHRFDWQAQRRAIIWVNQWSYWCIPCRMEFPAMQALQDRVGRDKLRIVLYSQPQNWRQDQAEARLLGLTFELITAKDASVEDRAAIALGNVKQGRAVNWILPSNSFVRASGEGLAAWQSPRDWDGAAWATRIDAWYEQGSARR